MQQLFNTPSIMRPAMTLLAMMRRSMVMLIVLIATTLALESPTEAATLASTLQRLAGVASAEAARLLGLLGIFAAAGLVLAIDRRHRIRTPRSTV